MLNIHNNGSSDEKVVKFTFKNKLTISIVFNDRDNTNESAYNSVKEVMVFDQNIQEHSCLREYDFYRATENGAIRNVDMDELSDMIKFVKDYVTIE